MVSQQAAPPLSEPAPHSVPVMPVAGIAREYADHGTKMFEEQNDRVDGFTTLNTHVEGLEPRGEGTARAERLSLQIHVEYIWHNM